MKIQENFINEDVNEYVRRSGFFVSLSAHMKVRGITCTGYCFMYSGSDSVTGFKLVETVNLNSPIDSLENKLKVVSKHLLEFYGNERTQKLSLEEVVDSFREDLYAFPNDEDSYLNMIYTIKLISPYFNGIVISCNRNSDSLTSFLVIDKYGSVTRTPKEWEDTVKLFLNHDTVITTLNEVKEKHREAEEEIQMEINSVSSQSPKILGQVIRPDISVWGGGNS